MPNMSSLAPLRHIRSRRQPALALVPVLEPAQVGANTEYAIRATGPDGPTVFLQRIAPFVTQSRLILGVWRGK